MINAEFYLNSSERLTGFCIKGHAGLADYGRDIACASVSSAVMLTANTITEAFKLKADVNVNENDISLKLEQDDNSDGDRLILGLMTHLYFLSDEFHNRIKVKIINT